MSDGKKSFLQATPATAPNIAFTSVNSAKQHQLAFVAAARVCGFDTAKHLPPISRIYTPEAPYQPGHSGLTQFYIAVKNLSGGAIEAIARTWIQEAPFEWPEIYQGIQALPGMIRGAKTVDERQQAATGTKENGDCVENLVLLSAVIHMRLFWEGKLPAFNHIVDPIPNPVEVAAGKTLDELPAKIVAAETQKARDICADTLARNWVPGMASWIRAWLGRYRAIGGEIAWDRPGVRKVIKLPRAGSDFDLLIPINPDDPGKHAALISRWCGN